jgi:hypothetical protein
MKSSHKFFNSSRRHLNNFFFSGQSFASCINKILPTSLAVLAGLALAPRSASALVVLTVQQQGADVVITGSGSANTTDLSANGTSSDWTNYLADTQMLAGPSVFGDGSVSLWSGLSGPALLSNNNLLYELPDATASSGQLFGIQSAADNGLPHLILPLAYSSGATLSGVSTFRDVTLSGLGLTPGTLRWTWGAGASQDSLEVRIPDPQAVPAPIPVAAAALLFSQMGRLRRCSQRMRASRQRKSANRI